LTLSNTAVSGGLPNLVDANVFATLTNTISYTMQGCLSATFAPNICADDLNWDFGDPSSGGNNTSTLSHPTHIFSAPGTYTVTLNASGVIITCEVEIDYQLSVAGRDSLCVTTSNNSAIYITNLPTSSQTLSWSVTGGSGSITGPTNQQNAFVTWTSLPGTLTVTLTDADAGCVSTTTYDVYSNCDTSTACPCGFKANYVYTFDQKKCLYTFHGHIDGPPCLNILKYEWDFGDGTTSTLPNPQHTFPANGSYIVCLTITASNGTQVCQDKYCEEIKVNCQQGGCDCKLSPSFTYTIDYQRCLVRFSGASGGPACLQNVQYFWDFGDGTTGTGQFASHVYTAPGSYVICLTVQAFNGITTCSSTYCFEITHDCRGTKSLQLDDPGTEIFPNPAQSEVNVRLDVAEAGPVKLTLLSTDGKTLLSETRQLEAGTQTVQITLPESIATGVAFLEIRVGDRTTTHKIALRH
jgi:PKD repeat protein